MQLQALPAETSVSDARQPTVILMRTASAAPEKSALQEAAPAAAEKQNVRALTVIADNCA